jgi:hypothetical protein
MRDEDLLAALSSMQAILKSDLKAEISSVKVDLLEHIHSVGAQLHTQIQEVDTRLTERLERIETRLDRQGGLMQSGSRAITRMIEWTESGDMTFAKYDRRLAIFERRLDEVEKGKNGKSNH